MDWLSSALAERLPLPGGGLPTGVVCPLEGGSGLGLSLPLPPAPPSTRPTADRTARTRDGDTLRLPGGLTLLLAVPPPPERPPLDRLPECFSAASPSLRPGGIGWALARPFAGCMPALERPAADSGASSPTFCRTWRWPAAAGDCGCGGGGCDAAAGACSCCDDGCDCVSALSLVDVCMQESSANLGCILVTSQPSALNGQNVAR